MSDAAAPRRHLSATDRRAVAALADDLRQTHLSDYRGGGRRG